MRKFYAHFDHETGKIFSVGPVADNDVYPDAEYMEMDEETAMKFLRHERSMMDWFIDKSGDKHILVQNYLNVPPENPGVLFEVPRLGKVVLQGIQIKLSVPDDIIEFSIPERSKGQQLDAIKEKTMTFVLTKRNDPTYVVGEFVVSISELIAKGRLMFPTTCDLNDYSLFTKRVFLNYQFEVSHSGRGMSFRSDTMKINKMVSYTSKPVKKGIVASYDEDTHTLNFNLVGKTKLWWPDNAMCPVFLTKPRDPTIVYHKLMIDVESFWENKKISLQLPKDIHSEFGLAGYPLADTMAFVRVNNDTSS
jgi:hypothetical protein